MDNQFKPTHSGTPPEPPVDVRVQLTKTIWGCSVGMLGICIPLVALTHSPVLPMCVLAAAALGTVALWLGKGGSPQGPVNAQATAEQLRQLEERVANMETITRFERSLHERDAMGSVEGIPSPLPEKERPMSRPTTPISY